MTRNTIFVFIAVWLICFGLAFLKDHSKISGNNSLRKTILSDSASTWAVIENIRESRSRNFSNSDAVYKYDINNEYYHAFTFKKYEGKVGDSIRIVYQKGFPQASIYYKEIEKENYQFGNYIGAATVLVIGIIIIERLFKFIDKKYVKDNLA
ncbi:MAG: hypothetical protein QM737_18285 [Ferruginibacter sp.]